MNKGLMVAFLGTDGSGKTTIINGLPAYLKEHGVYYDITYYHWRPGYIVKKDPSKEGVRVDNPHANPQYGFIKSLIKFIIINFDYLLGYHFDVKKRIKKGELVIFDRYFYDYYLDKLRYRLSLSDSFMHLFQFMIPKPDMTFLLLGTPEVLYERKREVSVEEIKEQCLNLIRFEKYMKPAMEINVDRPIDVVVEQVGSWIVKESRREK